MSFENCDYIVVGSGLAGLTFALHAAEHGSVTILTKSAITESNTNWAQGGIAAAVGDTDSWELHEEDTHIAGAGLCDPEAVRFLVQSAPSAIEWLRGRGAEFDLAGSNELDLGREGGHSRRRIVRHADKTGWEIERVVSNAVRSSENIRIYENTFVTHLILNQGACVGVTAEVAGYGKKSFSARASLLATGGAGQVYQNTTNPRVATADGVAMAARIGADVRHMEFQQFHPTTLHHPQLSGFLITEALRGAGATLRNHQGRRFMFDYDQRLELAPRDVVARAIEQELEKLATWCVYLDASHLNSNELQREFPTIWQRLRTIGIEIEKDWIPVVPAQHYSCGGISTDLHARTNIPGLFASGECACTGVHGANRLASNSLLEAIVFSQAAAESAKLVSACPLPDHSPDTPPCIMESEAIRIRHALQKTMSQHAGVFKTTAGLQRAQGEIKSLIRDYESAPRAPFSAYGLETKNLLDVGLMVVESSLARESNIGLHHNADLASHST